MSKTKTVGKYRLAWNFSGTKDLKSQLNPKLSPTIMLGKWDFYIEFIYKTLPSGNSSYSFRIRNPHLVVPILTSTYYLLDEATGQHHKLLSLSPFLTDWFDLDYSQNQIDFLVVVVLEIVNVHTKSECWLEGNTEALNNIQMIDVSGCYSALVNEKQLRLNVISETNKDKTILLDGLEQDESVLLDVGIHQPDVDYNRNLQLTLQSYETKSWTY